MPHGTSYHKHEYQNARSAPFNTPYGSSYLRLWLPIPEGHCQRELSACIDLTLARGSFQRKW